MARAFWKGAISFGMVVIPVRMYVATRTTTPSFHLLHRKCMTRPRQVLYCPLDNEYFERKDTVRGYEYAKGQYVVLTDSDFEKVPLATTHRVDIQGFTEAAAIDPVYYYDTHYLEPEELAIKPFTLLGEVLEKTKRVGIAKVSFQRREHLCCLRPLDGILALHTLHYPDEIVPREGLAPARPEIRPEELEMATSLVNAMARSFAPEQFHDEYRNALRKLIEAKVKGEQIVAPVLPKAEIADLMSALRASVEAARKREQEAVAAK